MCNRELLLLGQACFYHVEPVTGLEQAGLAVISPAQERIAGFPGTKLKAPDCSGASDGAIARLAGYRCAHEIMTSTILGTRNKHTAPPRFLPMASISPLNLMAAMPIKKGVAAIIAMRLAVRRRTA